MPPKDRHALINDDDHPHQYVHAAMSIFKFERAGRKGGIPRHLLRGLKSGGKARFHRKHSLSPEDMKRYLEGQQPLRAGGKRTKKKKGNEISDTLKARLLGHANLASKKVKTKPVVKVFRDVLQPDYARTPLPLRRTSKADSLTWRGYELWTGGTVTGGPDQVVDEAKVDYRASVTAFTSALIADENHFYAKFYRSLAYATCGRFRPALRDMTACIVVARKWYEDRMIPEHAEGLLGPGTDSAMRLLFACTFNSSLLHLNVHMHNKAVGLLNQCEALDRHAPEVRFLRGFIRRRRGNYWGCRQDYVIGTKLQHRKDLGVVAAALLEHAPGGAKRDKRNRADLGHIVRSPVKKSQILSFLTSTQKALMTPGQDRNEMHMQYIAAMFTPHTFFTHLDEDRQTVICRDCEYNTLEAGEWVCRRGDPSDAFYVVLSGVLNVMVLGEGMATETHGGTLQKGDTFGELGLLYGTNRTASVHVHSPSEIVTIPGWIFEQHTEVRDAMLQVQRDKREAIVGSGIFGGLPEQYLEEATNYATIRIYDQGQTLVRQGQHAQSVFVMLSGVCEVWQRIDVRGELVRRRKTLQQELESYRTRYVFHHQLVYQHAGADGVGETEAPAVEEGRTSMRPYADTALEKKVVRLQHDVDALNKQIKAIDMAAMNKYRKMTRWQRLLAENRPAGAGPDENAKQVRKVKLREVMQPSFFGEASLRGDGAIEACDVIAQTRCKVLRIFTPQMDFSKVNDEFLDRLQNLSAVRPLCLEDLTAAARGETGWGKFRKNMLTFIDKAKWPVKNSIVTEGPSGTSLIVELPQPHGTLK